MNTGIKISSPATFSVGKSINGLFFFALSNPEVSAIFKTSETGKDEISLKGIKTYQNGFLDKSISYLKSFDLFKNTPPLKIEIQNSIPFGKGLGAHISCFASLLKGYSVINKLSLTNRELYSFIAQDRYSFLHKDSTGRLLTSLEGGAMFVDPISPDIFQRLFLPQALSVILLYQNDVDLKSLYRKDIETIEYIRDYELILGLSSSNWNLIRRGLNNSSSVLNNLNISESLINLIIDNSLGFDFENDYGKYLFLIENSLQQSMVYDALMKLNTLKEYQNKFQLYTGKLDYTGTKKY